MRVNLVSRFKPGIGIGSYSKYLYDALVKIDETIKFVNVDVPAHRSSEILSPFWIAPHLRKETADLYHGDYLDSGLAAMIACKKPIVVTIHDAIPFVYPQDRNPIWRMFHHMAFSALLNKNVAIITVSEASKTDLIKYSVNPDKIHVVYNGVDHTKFFPLVAPNKPNKIVIGYLASLAKRKRVDRLIDAYAILKSDYPEIELRIGGKGPLFSDLKQRAKATKAADIHFLGFVPEDEMNNFYNALDIFVYPSDYEGFGLPILEAMACKTAVIGTNVSSIPEVIGDAGILAGQTPESLADGIQQLLDDRDKLDLLAERGYQRSLKFTWDESARKTTAVYQKVLNDN